MADRKLDETADIFNQSLEDNYLSIMYDTESPRFMFKALDDRYRRSTPHVSPEI